MPDAAPPGTGSRLMGLRARGWFLLAAALSLAIFLIHFGKVGYGVYGDGLGYYAPLRSLLFDGNLSVTDEFRRFASYPGRWPFTPMEVSKYPIGLSLLLLPFFLLGHVVALLLRGLGAPVVADGLSWPYELFYCGGSLALGVAGLVLCWRMARLRFGEAPATLAAAGVWFASPLSYYLLIENSMSHAVSQFLVSSFLYLVLTRDWRRRTRQQLLLGGVLGLAALVRFQDGLFITVPLVLALLEHRTVEPLSRRLRPVLVVGAVAGICLIPQALLYIHQFGGLGGVPYLREGSLGSGGRSFDWLHPKILSVLFSGFHGLFAWHPLTLLGIAGLLLLLRDEPRTAAALLAGFAVQVWLVASWYAWPQGASLGGRMFASSSFIFTLGLAALWREAEKRKARTLAVLATLFLIGWNAVLALRYLLGLIPAEAPVPLGRLLGGQFQAVPVILNRLFG